MAGTNPSQDSSAATSPPPPHPPPSSSSSSSQQGSLVFVNVSNPAAIDSQSVRRLVRSSATRHSHRDPTRKPKARRTNRSAASSRTSPKPSITSGRSSPDDETEQRPALPEHSYSLFTHDERLKVTNIIDQFIIQSEADLKVGQSEQYAAQPNNSYPVDAEEWFPWVLSYYRTIYLPQGIRILQSSEREGEDFINWFLREGHSEPALFYMQLLTACTQLVDGNQLPHSHVDWLQGMVVRTINAAISDPSRASSTATLLSVALIALHERLYGDKNLATEVHGRAFASMVEMAGGVEQLELPRLAWRLLLWADIVVSGEISVDQTTMQLLQTWVPPRWRPSKPG